MHKLTLNRWLTHFQKNQADRSEPDWQEPTRLGDEELRELVPSLAQFELGDGGGPAYLIAWNREKFLTQDHARRLVDLWFKEEEEHSRLLGQAVRKFKGKHIVSHWSFSVFCKVRQIMGVSFELRTLLLTEIVSNAYYQLMLKHGGPRDASIAQMCRLIIRDETGHIAFHKDRLSLSHKSFGMIWAGLFNLMGLAAGTMLWINHGRAIRALGGTTAEFYDAIWQAMDRFIQGLRRKTNGPPSALRDHPVLCDQNHGAGR